jgi:hypothetical protein
MQKVANFTPETFYDISSFMMNFPNLDSVSYYLYINLAVIKTHKSKKKPGRYRSGSDLTAIAPDSG